MLAHYLVGNRQPFLPHIRGAHLSLLMRHFNGVCGLRYSRRHGLVGHLLQGRFKAILVDCDACLLEVCRYVEPSAVRAALVDGPAGWPWSTYRSHVGMVDGPAGLDTSGLHGHLLGQDAQSVAYARKARRPYA
jgi:putative transposase